MDHIMIKIQRLVIFSSLALPILCGAVGEFAVNIAYGKPTAQSSTYIGIKEYGDTPGYPYNASLAVDGNTDTRFKNDGCSHTDLNSNSAWWEVDLLDLYNVLNITIYQRSDGNTNRLSGFVTKGKVSNDSWVIIDNPKSTMAGIITIPVNTSLKFKGIRIELTKKNIERAAICLCEVEVLAEINVAEKKLAKQSSIYKEAIHFDASLAVDGNTNTNFTDNSCSCTNPGDLNPWWSVDLQAVYFVIGIRIYQRMDSNMNRLKGYTLIGVHANGSNETIQTPQPYQTGEIVIHVAPLRMLKEIRVHLNHSDLPEGPIITLCEVQVFAGTMCPKPPPFPRKGLYKFIPGNEGNWSYNFSLILHCIEGYNIDGPISVRCEDINRWNGTFGSCSVKRCTRPVPQVSHGFLAFHSGIEGNGTYNTIVSLNCIEGYKRDSIDQLRCADDDRWQGNLGLCSVKRCNKQLTQVDNGILTFKDGIGGNQTYNTIVTLRCNEGYKNSSLGQLRCADEDQWQGKLGLCMVKRCTQPVRQVAHGILTFRNGIDGNGTYNTTVNLNCNEGYKRSEAGQLRCADEDEWQGSLGLCIVKRCTQPVRQVAHGILTFKNGIDGIGTYNTTVTLNCNEGYKRSKAEQLRCADGDEWQGTLGLCLVKRCTQPIRQVARGILTFRNGIDGKGTYNTTVTLNCNEGYKRSEAGQLRCADEDEWQGTLGLCMVKRCTQPVRQVAHGILTFKNGIDGIGTYNTTVTLNCNEGYKRRIGGQLRCADEDEWQGTLGLCLVKRCDKPPPRIPHGVLTFKDGLEGNGTYNTTMSLNCTEGYKLDSHAQLRCAGDGQWQGTLGRCLVKRCDKPLSLIAHGVLTFKDGLEGNGTYNTTVSLNCTEGYKLDGHAHLRCAGEGQWQGTLGRCLVKRCDKPPSLIAHGVLTFKGGLEGSGTYNTTVFLNCTEGYKLDSYAQLRCAGDEQWQGTLGRCLVKRCEKQHPQIAHGVLTFKDGLEGNGTYNTTVSLNCNEGYKRNRLSRLRCVDDEEWQGTLGICLVKRCEEQPPQIAHGVLSFTNGLEGNGTYNTTVSLNCAEGYKLNNLSKLRCADDEQWQGTLGFCLVKRCEKPPSQIAHGVLTFKDGLGGKGTYNGTVSLNCTKGYERDSHAELRCANDEEWQGTLGQCLESMRNGETESSVARIAGGVTATIGAIILGVIIAYYLYKRKARGPNDKMADTTLNTIPSSSRRKGHNEEVIFDTPIYAQPNKMKRAEIDETKHTSQKVTDKHSIRVDDLSSFFLSRKMEPGLYEEEYSKLPNGLTKSHEEALLPENKSKNRYKNIYPYDDTRVRLEIWDPNIGNDYINACYINGFKTVRAYIAAQGPTKGILNDFWRMVWQTKCGKIVMLTNLIEEGKHKCEQYWPDEGSVEYGDIVIRLVQCEKFSDFTIRTLELRKTVERKEEEKNKVLQVKQFHFTAWPDRGVPKFASSLIHFRHKIHTTEPRRNSEGPIVVHCSAGIGRTGTFLALDYLVDQAEEMGYINVVNCVENLRKQRVNLVQTLEQYIFLHETLVEALTCTTIAMSTSEFQENYRKLLERDTKTGKRRLDDEFEKLTMYVSEPGEDVYANAKDMENRDKNRYYNILPDKYHCPYLNVYVKGRDSYINAVFLPAYNENDTFVVTQTPLENTSVDFWRMVYQLEVSSIVMLNTLSEMKEEERYWTENEETLEIVPFRITLESKTSDDICTNYTMLLTYHDERRRVRLSRATYWTDKMTVPKSPTAMLKQIDLIQRWQQETGNKPVVVHCMNGEERSGLFCVVAALLQRTQIEHDVAVEHIIKQMRSRRPQVIPNVDQFKFCFDAVSAYLDQFDT